MMHLLMKPFYFVVPMLVLLTACTQNQATSCIQSWWNWDSQKSICFIDTTHSGVIQSWSLSHSWIERVSLNGMKPMQSWSLSHTWDTIPQTYTGKAISVEEINTILESRIKSDQVYSIDLLTSEERQGFALWAKEQNFTKPTLTSTGKLQWDDYFVLTQLGNIADNEDHGCGMYDEGICYVFIQVAWIFSPVFLQRGLSILSISWSSNSEWIISSRFGDSCISSSTYSFLDKDGKFKHEYTKQDLCNSPNLSIGGYSLRQELPWEEPTHISKNLFATPYEMHDPTKLKSGEIFEIHIKFPDRYESRYLSGIESDRYNQPQKDFEIPFANRESYFLSFDTIKQWSDLVSSKFKWWETSLTYDKLSLTESEDITTFWAEGVSAVFHEEEQKSLIEIDAITGLQTESKSTVFKQKSLPYLQVWTCDPNNKNSYDSVPYRIQSYNMKKKSFEYRISEKFNNICTIPYVFDFFNSEGKHMYFPIVIEK